MESEAKNTRKMVDIAKNGSNSLCIIFNKNALLFQYSFV